MLLPYVEPVLTPFVSQLGFIFIFFCYPEPSGLSLEEIQVIYEHGFGVAKSREIRAEHKQARLSEQIGRRDSGTGSGDVGTGSIDEKYNNTYQKA